jgi:hypothetical protein
LRVSERYQRRIKSEWYFTKEGMHCCSPLNNSKCSVINAM